MHGAQIKMQVVLQTYYDKKLIYILEHKKKELYKKRSIFKYLISFQRYSSF